MDKFTDAEKMKLEENIFVRRVDGNKVIFNDEFHDAINAILGVDVDIEVFGAKRISLDPLTHYDEEIINAWDPASWEVTKLRNNPNVKFIKANRIYYAERFKAFFIQEYKRGVTPTEIFRRGGFDVKFLGRKRIERFAARMRERMRLSDD